METELPVPYIHGQKRLFTYAARLSIDTFCEGADDGYRDVIYYWNQGLVDSSVHPGQARLFHGKLGHNGNDTQGDVTEQPIEDNLVWLHPDNVVELHPQEAA